MNYRLQHNARGSVSGGEVPLGAFQQSKQKWTIYLLQNRTFLFVANSVFSGQKAAFKEQDRLGVLPQLTIFAAAAVITGEGCLLLVNGLLT